MGSLIMHLTVSNIIKEKYNLSDAFLAGSIMPDIYGKCKIPRDLTHFITTEKIDPDLARLPNIKYFINKYSDNLTNDLLLGYLCHLIEDRVWFREFIPKYAKVVSYVDNTILFLNDKTIHNEKEFSEEIYFDYNKIDLYLLNKYNLNINNIKETIKKYYTEDYSKEALNNYLYKHDVIETRDNIFLTENEAEIFIEKSLIDIDKIAGKYLEHFK